jgi:hypothetical protein
VDTVDRADVNACRVLGSDTGICDYECHWIVELTQKAGGLGTGLYR